MTAGGIRIRWAAVAAAAVVAAGLAGCTTAQRKTTPFYSQASSSP